MAAAQVQQKPYKKKELKKLHRQTFFKHLASAIF